MRLPRDREAAHGAAALSACAIGLALLWLALGTADAPDLDASGARDWSGDFRSYYLPNAEYAGMRLARGELPLWNPRQGAGMPFLATLQVGVLYPPNALHALVPVQTAFVALAALHLGLAVLLAGGLALALGAGAAGAALTGLAYAGSVQVVGAVWSPPVQYAAAWAPGLLLGVERTLARPGARPALGLALAIGLSLLCGWPYAVAIALLGAGLYAALRLVAAAVAARRLPWRAGLALLAGICGGVALAGPQLAPTLELLARSCRAFGSLVEAQAIGGNVNRPHEPSVFLGILAGRGYNDGIPGWPALPLAAAALILPGPGRRRVAALLAIGALGLLASFPHHAPVYGWLRELPVYADFRFPFRYRLLPTLALAVAAGVGLDRVQRLLSGRRRLALAAGLAGIALQLGSVTVPLLARALPFPRRWPSAPDPVLAEVGAQPNPTGRLFWAGRAEKLRAGEPAAVLYDLEPLFLARSAELLTWFETGRPLTLLTLPRPEAGRAPGDAVAPPFFGRLGLPESAARAAVLDLFSVTRLVASDPPAWLDERYERRAGPAGLAVFENPRALPRAYRVAAAVPEPGDLRVALHALTSSAFDPRRVAMLDAAPDALVRAARPGPPRSPPPVEILAYTPERVQLRSRDDLPGLVVLTDAFHPGWEARVDGEPAPLLRANLAFRGVPVPAGSHEVELRYRPATFRRAAALSLALLAAGIAVAWRDPFRRA
jgi:hypothetical protein